MAALMIVSLLVVTIFSLVDCCSHDIFFDPMYMLFYALVIGNLPLAIGPLALRAFEQGERAAIKLYVSLGFTVAMALYTVMNKLVVRMMTGPYIYPRFLFLGKLYYYTFWYVVFGVTPLGTVFYVMLLIMNFHYVAVNADLYLDALMYLGRHLSWCQCWDNCLGLYKSRSARKSDIFDMIFNAKATGQDNFSDVYAMVAVPLVIAFKVYMQSDGKQMKETDDELNDFYPDADLFIRYAIMAFSRLIAAIFCKISIAKKLKRMRRRLELWSVIGDLGKSGKIAFAIGYDAQMKRDFRRRTEEFLIEKNVHYEDVPLYAQRYYRDLNFSVFDSSDRTLKYHTFTEDNFRLCFWYYCTVSISVMFTVFATSEDTGRMAFYVDGI